MRLLLSTLCVLLSAYKCVNAAVDPDCDDGKTNIFADYKGKYDYLCYEDELDYMPSKEIHRQIHHQNRENVFQPKLVCMNQTIPDFTKIPVFGNHRPILPPYGVYKYLPKERWLHNLKHGAIVMLYHPCANRQQIHNLVNVVRGCLTNYIITPHRELSHERPLALVAWGHRMLIPRFNKTEAIQFISSYANKGPMAPVAATNEFNYLLKYNSYFDPVMHVAHAVCEKYAQSDQAAFNLTKWQEDTNDEMDKIVHDYALQG